jgi:putative ABC transport system ATP-binding protein
VQVVKKGDYFGEMGPLFGMPRAVSARARTHATVVGYTVEAFREKLGPKAVRNLIEHRVLAGRL